MVSISKVKLTTGKHALVDGDDYARVNKHRWWQSNSYAATRIDGKFTYMHRFIMDTPEDMHTDHINRNKLDNRRSNLRICTPSQNLFNLGRKRGVGWHKASKKWRAYIQHDGKHAHIGLFNKKTDAEKAWLKYAKENIGEYVT